MSAARKGNHKWVYHFTEGSAAPPAPNLYDRAGLGDFKAEPTADRELEVA